MQKVSDLRSGSSLEEIATDHLYFYLHWSLWTYIHTSIHLSWWILVSTSETLQFLITMRPILFYSLQKLWTRKTYEYTFNETSLNQPCSNKLHGSKWYFKNSCFFFSTCKTICACCFRKQFFSVLEWMEFSQFEILVFFVYWTISISFSENRI